MKRNKLVTKLLFILFTALMMILVLNQTALNVKALSTGDYSAAEKVFENYDGITNWKLQSNSPSNNIGNIPIGGDVSLGYTFGAARDSTGKIVAGDNTITKQSAYTMNNSVPNVSNGKINIFLNYNGKYYGILHQGTDSYNGTGGSPQNASDSSIDYALLTGNGTSNYYSGMNVLTNLSEIDSSAKTYKQYYTGTDANGVAAFKLLGYYSKRSVFVEIVLKASITGAPIVQRELYVYNPSSSTSSTQFQTFYGEDTGLNPNNGDTTVDNVPMYAIGNGQGLYLMSGSNYQPASKLFVTNNINGGFQDFMGRILSNPTDWSVKGKQNKSTSDITAPKLPWASNPTSDQDGDTNDAAGTNLLISNGYNVVNSAGLQDSAYTLRWPQTNLSPGQVAEFSSTIGATVAGYAVPMVSKTYTNLTSPNSTVNHVGDKLRFSLNVKNEGYQSAWTLTKILDNMPEGLTIDKSTTQSTLINGDAIDFNPNTNINSDSGVTSASYTFDATINNQAPYYLTNGNLTNTAYFTGNNVNQSDSKTYKASIDVPVETPTFKYRFTKQVRNDTTDPNGTFSSKTTGKKDDIIEYNVNFTSNGTSTLSGANFADSLPDGLELVPGSITLDGTAKDSLNFSVGSLSNNSTHVISFKAKVTGIEASTASNTAYLNNVLTNTGQQYSSIATEAPADVDIEAAPLTTSFVEVPTTIDFGSVNSAALERTLSNVSTTGKLIITHTADTPFQVNVSYDNNGDHPIASNGTKLIQDNGESLLFNQANSDTDNNWYPLTPDPVPIKSDGFSGSLTNYDLSNYVGANKWKLRVPADSKAGAYSGQVTWSMNDSIQ
ncbi:DUF11 domain-containing protein [Companilactobacillus huachuanensis]|uniref:DUF11 domain-containing protein n=1 Tax=Companilactobacillus huachuanensis TaxID=2559914 RepID=A0ABW1RI96_9LACO|nr:DUF11 domain-containing protein [Companilactobacillus huachuanensis]